MHVGCSVDGVRINISSFADDMVLLGPTVRTIREMLRVCESYAASHGFSYNVSKCEYMFFKAGGKCPEVIPQLTRKRMNITRVLHFNYLGHKLTDDLKDNVDIERKLRALAVRGNITCWLIDLLVARTK